jgi:TM2 domain-containing membrane protein YozV
MSYISSQPNKGTAFLLSFFFGAFGIDKFYVGATSLGVLQLLLTLSLLGLLISLPWAFISTIVIGVSILTLSNPILYPDINWAPDSPRDKVILLVIFILFILSMFRNIKREFYKDKDIKDDKKNNLI